MIKIFLPILFSIQTLAVDYAEVDTALNNNETEKALELVKQISKTHADYKKIDYLKARIAFRQRGLDKAEDYIKKAVKSYPHADVYSLAGGIYGMQAATANIFFKLGYARKSKKYLQKAYAAEPTNKNYIAGLIQFNIQAPSIAGGDSDAVEPLLKQLDSLDKKLAVQLRAQFIADEDDEETAIKYLNSVITENPNEIEYKYYRAFAYAGMEDYVKAVNDYQSVIADKSDGWQASSVRINSLYQLGRLASMEKKWLQQGKASYLEFLSIEDTKNAPSKSWANYRLGLIYKHLKQMNMAKKLFQKALAMNPEKRLKKRLAKEI